MGGYWSGCGEMMGRGSGRRREYGSGSGERRGRGGFKEGGALGAVTGVAVS